MVDRLRYLEDETTIEISGYAFFRGMNASTDSDVTHMLLLVDQESGEEIPYEADTTVLDEPMDFADGYDYSRIAYQARVDLSALPEGNYALKIRVENGDQSDSTLLISSRIKDLENKTVDGCLVRVFARAIANYRLEISKEKNSLDFSTVSKPTRRNSVYAENSLELTDNVLSIDATAFIYGTNIRTEDKPEYTLVLLDETGKEYRYPAEVYVGDSDPAKLLKLNVELTSANFRISENFSDLKDGTYRMYLDLKTNDSHDLFELYNLRRKENLVSEVNEKEIRLIKETTHSRYVLQVTDKSIAH